MNKELMSIRESYDGLADEYARRLIDELQGKPLDRELLTRFLAQVNGRGEVCDMGCGPGHIARFLRDRGARVFGLDLSPRMLEQARQLYPDILFCEGNMMALDLPTDSLAGIVAFYAIVNIPKKLLAVVFREMHRVLEPGGLLLLAFHTGDETVCLPELWGQPISMEWFLLPTSEICRSLEAAQFVVKEVIERGPYAPEVEAQTNRTYIFARKSLQREK